MKKKVARKRTKSLSAKQKEALSKGHEIMKAAIAIQKAFGTRTVPERKVYKMKMSDALKKAARMNLKLG